MKSIKFLALVSCLCTFMSCTEKEEEKTIDDSNAAPQRRVKKDAVPEGRRTAPKYNVVNKEETVSE